jgi:putative spermidine/putrescine transport system ATP-binding protein
MQIEVKRLQRELDITTVMVTHDQEEALSLAGRIAVMNHGRVEQLARPEEIYDRPTSLFVATFVGTANLLRGELVPLGAGFALERAGGDALLLPAAEPCSRPGRVVASVRPEHLAFVKSAGPGLDGTIELVLPLGASIVYDVVLRDGTPLKVTTVRGADVIRHDPGDTVRVAVVPGAPLSVFAEP